MTTTTHRAGNAPDRLRRSLRGTMWHGDAIDELLADVSAHEAARPIIPGAHSIWALVLHMTAWAAIVQARLRGVSLGSPPAAQDFPPVPARVSARGWMSARAKLTKAHDDLADAVAMLPADAWTTPVRGKPHTIGEMIDGIVEHTAYHGGQIALLKRALHARAEPD